MTCNCCYEITCSVWPASLGKGMLYLQLLTEILCYCNARRYDILNGLLQFMWYQLITMCRAAHLRLP